MLRRPREKFRCKNSYLTIMGAHLCTGTLLNDVAQDWTPYFLTANHCVNSQAVAETVEAYWFYQTTSCNSGVLRNWSIPNPAPTSLRCKAPMIFPFMRLQTNAPGGAFFSGWTATAQPLGTSVFGLHQPDEYGTAICPFILTKGYWQYYEHEFQLPRLGKRLRHWLECSLTGTWEPGSSGSGLFTSNGHYLVGALSCGPLPPTCNNPDAGYSKFANFYPQIRQDIY